MVMQRHVRLVEELKDSARVECPSVRVAFATSDLRRIDQHFGSAERFAIYEIEANHSRLVEVAEFGSQKQDGNESKLLEKFVLVEKCAAVYSLAIGPSAVRQLMGIGVQPFRVPEYTTINALIGELQHELQDGPSGWLARAIQGKEKDADRFDEMAADEWQE